MIHQICRPVRLTTSEAEGTFVPILNYVPIGDDDEKITVLGAKKIEEKAGPQ
jgi:hypothetical protein